MKVGEG